MKTHEIAIACIIAIAGGGYIGVAWDRYRRRPPADEYPKRYVNDVRMNRLHIIDDEYPARSSAVQREPLPPHGGRSDHHQPPTP